MSVIVDPEAVAAYLASVPEERREAISTVRDVILQNLPAGYVEMIAYKMLCYVIPLERYPDTYNGQALQYAALANQKNYMSVYLTTVYGDPEAEAWFREGFAKAGKKLDMGKSCVRFKKLDDLPLDVIGQAIARLSVEDYIRTFAQQP